MSILNGNAGAVKISTNTVAQLRTWKLDVSTASEDVTYFGQTWEGAKATIKSFTGTADGDIDITDTNGQVAILTDLLAATEVTMKFYIDATHYFSGACVIDKYSVDCSVKGIVKVSYSFKGNGALSYN